jgi:hypothetical protein
MARPMDAGSVGDRPTGQSLAQLPSRPRATEMPEWVG